MTAVELCHVPFDVAFETKVKIFQSIIHGKSLLPIKNGDKHQLKRIIVCLASQGMPGRNLTA